MSTTAQIIFGIVLLVFAVFLVVAVLLQEGKSYGLGGAIAGGADTMFGKTRGKKVSDLLSRITTIIAVIFAVLVIVLTTINRVEGVTPDLGEVNATPTEATETTTATTESTTEDATTAEATETPTTATETPADVTETPVDTETPANTGDEANA